MAPRGLTLLLGLIDPGQSVGGGKWLESARGCAEWFISHLHPAVLEPVKRCPRWSPANTAAREHRLDGRQVVPWAGGAGRLVAGPPESHGRDCSRAIVDCRAEDQVFAIMSTRVAVSTPCVTVVPAHPSTLPVCLETAPHALTSLCCRSQVHAASFPSADCFR